MTAPRRLYFDNAATSFPKAPGVYDAMTRFGMEIGASPGRGGYTESQHASRLLGQCRQRLCRLINADSPDHLIFTLNATDALNLAIHGIARHFLRRDQPVHIITTAMDHNSVLRPLHALRDEGVELTCIPADPIDGLIDPDDVTAAIGPTTRLVCAVHGSNVSGSLQPIQHIGRLCREHGVPLLVDAAQTLGHMPIDVQAMNIDLLAFPGHKGLLGPLGTGGLFIRPGVESIIDPLRHGGTGSRSELPIQPAELPDRYEPGSHNTPGLIGLSHALDWIIQRSVESLWAHEQRLISLMLEGLLHIDGVRLLGPQTAQNRCGVFSIVHDTLNSATLAKRLEDEFGILTRAGLHCAPFAHQTFHSTPAGATRLSLGPFLEEADVLYATAAIASICKNSSVAVMP